MGPGSDPSQLREAKERVERGQDERVFGNVLVRRLPVEGVASARRREDALGFTARERQTLDLLRRRDQEVRSHESAHIAAANGLTVGSPKYTLTEGPDGRQYAIAGHVHIDTSPEPTPEATIEKAQRVKEAALAPSDPSAQDLRVVARASMMEMRARGELQAKRMAAASGGPSTEGKAGAGGGETVATRWGEASWSAGDAVHHRADDPGHLRTCSRCQNHAFVGRFQPTESLVLGVA